MRIPKDLTGADISKALRVLGYEKVLQGGSHIRLTTILNGVLDLTVPNHSPLKVGTLLGGALKPVAAHHGLSVEELLEKIGL